MAIDENYWFVENSSRCPEPFVDYVERSPEKFGVVSGGKRTLERLLLIGDLDGNKCILLVQNVSSIEWPALLYDPNLGFWYYPNLKEMFTREILFLSGLIKGVDREKGCLFLERE